VASQKVELDRELSRALRDLASRADVTLFVTSLTAWQVLLARYSRQENVIVGATIPGRNHSDLKGLIGQFENRLALRTDLSGNPTFRELLGRVCAVTLEAHAHQDLPFDMLLPKLASERNASHNPAFQVLFAFRDMPREDSQWSELRLHELPSESTVSPFDLSLTFDDSPNGLCGRLNYNTDLYQAETISRLRANFQVLLAGIVADPDQRIGELPLLTAAERQQVLVAWNQTATDDAGSGHIHQFFEEHAARTPEAIAVVSGDRQVTYRELNTRANQLAHHLIGLGVEPETLVGLCVERSVEMIVGLLGILKAGGAYVPLDPTYPAARLQFLWEDSRPAVLVTQCSLSGRLLPQAAPTILVDDDRLFLTHSAANPPCRAQAQNLAYVIYTSGSTGTPKGVAIEHHNTVTFIRWAQSVFTADELSGVLASTSICFDLSVFELFVTLSSGGRVILVENAFDLQSLPPESNVKLINTVPCVVSELLRLKAIPESVVTVNLAGELLSTEIVNAIYRETRAQRVYDLYGPSEDTTYSTYTLRLPDVPATIGRPIANTQAYVLDGRQQPVPVGVTGELYLGGDGLARGYLNRPKLTAEKFIRNPFSRDPLSRLYRTGDLARWREDGNLECLGRIDRDSGPELERTSAVFGRADVRQAAVQESEPDHVRFLEVIRTGDRNKPPIVCIGDSRPIPHITSHFEASVPVWHCRLHGTHVWPAAFMTIEEQIAIYVRSLTEQCPVRRKVHLIGFSYGGLLAYRLAAGLSNHGWTVMSIVLIEPNVPDRYLPIWPRLREKLRRTRLGIRYSGDLSQVDDDPDAAEQHRRLEIERTPGVSDRWNRMVRHYMHISGTASLNSLRKQIVLVGSKEYCRRFGKCWERIESGGVEYCALPDSTDHFTCFRRPSSTQWLAALKSCYDSELMLESGRNCDPLC
jgi:amino acid adenylation domain-containing protein